MAPTAYLHIHGSRKSSAKSQKAQEFDISWDCMRMKIHNLDLVTVIFILNVH